MLIKTKCGSCGAGLAAPVEKAGTRCKCPKCGVIIELPTVDVGSPVAGRSPQPSAAKRPAPPAAANDFDLEDLPGGADLTAFDKAASGDPFGAGMNLTAGATLSPQGGNPLMGPSTKNGRWLFGLEPWVWMIIGGGVSAVVMIILIAIGMRRNREPVVDPTEAVAQAPTVAPPKVVPPPRPGAGSPRNPSAGPVVAASKLPKPIADAYAGVVLIKPFDADGQALPHGTGFIVNERGHVATAYHVLAKAHSARAVFSNNETYDFSGYRGIDREHDLAICELSALPATVSVLKVLASEELLLRVRVFAIGHPEPERYVIEPGLVQGIFTTDQLPVTVRATRQNLPASGLWLQSDAVVVGDSGGGPLVNDAGEVLGLAGFQSTSVGKITGYYIISHHLEALMNSLMAEIIPLDSAAPPQASK